MLKRHEIAISMDGKGRCMDNIFIERLWRSLKYEEVYLHAYASVAAAKAGIGGWLSFYNEERLHQSHGYRTPHAVYEAQSAWTIDRADCNRLPRSAGADRDRQLRPEISPPLRTLQRQRQGSTMIDGRLTEKLIPIIHAIHRDNHNNKENYNNT